MTDSTNATHGNLNWTLPIEAVHRDGRVVPVMCEKDNGTNILPICISPMLYETDGSTLSWFNRDGSRDRSGWRIRNRKPAPSQDVPAELVVRMGALVRELAAYPFCNALGLQSEARAIVAALPEPVDPDLLLAREVALEQQQRVGCQLTAEAIIEGRMDGSAWVSSALAAIKRIRAEVRS